MASVTGSSPPVLEDDRGRGIDVLEQVEFAGATERERVIMMGDKFAEIPQFHVKVMVITRGNLA